MRTAVEWLEDRFKISCGVEFSEGYKEYFNTAKEIEKNQMIKFADNFDAYLNDCNLEGVYPLPSAEQYYNEKTNK